MRYAIIENGVVSNVVIADEELALTNGWVECSDAGPNWTYANGVFTKPSSVPQSTEPTKEELIAELAALSAKIQSLA
jgi:hypothetical protein